MCLTREETNNLPESVTAFKVFMRGPAGTYRSPNFQRHIFYHVEGEYEALCPVSTGPTSASGFYAFAKLEDAKAFQSYLEQGFLNSFVICEVTLIKVVGRGFSWTSYRKNQGYKAPAWRAYIMRIEEEVE